MPLSKVKISEALLISPHGRHQSLPVDPSFAKAFGFEADPSRSLHVPDSPRRHQDVLEQRSALLQEHQGSFLESVFPGGRTLMTEMWKDGDKITFRCKVKERVRSSSRTAA
jgi:multifunctional beta-oxidation protein